MLKRPEIHIETTPGQPISDQPFTLIKLGGSVPVLSPDKRQAIEARMGSVVINAEFDTIPNLIAALTEMAAGLSTNPPI